MRNSRDDGRDPFNQNFRKFRSKTQWIGSVQPEKFRKNGSTFWGGPLFPVGPVGILVEWIAPRVSCTQHLEVTRLPKAEVRKFEWSLYNIDAYVCNLEKKLNGMNYCVHQKSWIGILKARNVFRRLVGKFCANFSRKRKFRSCVTSAQHSVSPYCGSTHAHFY